MEISLRRSSGFDLIFKAENVNICEDIEERIYSKTEDGKTDYTNVKSDIKTEVLEQFVSIVEDLIYYREADFDSSGLIERLFDKLPLLVAVKLIEKLRKDYEIKLD